MGEVSFSELAKLAAKQHGLMTHAQATAAGLSRMALSRLVHKGAWEMVRPRVFRRKAASQTEAQALLAVCLCRGEGTVVSHRSAGRLLGLDLKQGELEVTTPLGGRQELPGVVAHRTRSLDPKDTKEHRGIPITTGARTLIDLASCLDEEALAIVVEEAWRKEVAAPDWVQTRLKKLRVRGRRTGALAEILSDCRKRDKPLESALEVRVWRLLKRSKLPMPIPNYEFRDDFGQPGRIDFAYPSQQLSIEAEGFGFHGNRDVFEKDRLRTSRLVALGWRVMPVTWKQLDEQRDQVVQRIRLALGFRTESIAKPAVKPVDVPKTAQNDPS